MKFYIASSFTNKDKVRYVSEKLKSNGYRSITCNLSTLYFFDSKKSNLPFTNGWLTYETTR
ncbi:GTPase SAR1 [Solibacillus silvestris StLB046]|uniref:GTPase SAR1 n=1 Tax=Solibacillus silvestris (strain StLB046) TaxID=1002809 RepID=F2F9F6_SOLSS|nr:GTPase SAR1 [Solibacillus silvestris StLB046]